MPKILKEEILKAEDKAFFQYVLDHQCVPNVVEVEEEEGDGGVGRMAGSRSAAASRTATRGWKSVYSPASPPCGLAALPPATVAARNSKGARERAAEDSVQPDHQPVVVSKRQREHREQPAEATAVEDAFHHSSTTKGK